MPTLDSPLRVIGDKPAKALHQIFEMETVGDLLRHYPRRYDERGAHTDLASLRIGEDVTVLAQVQKTNLRKMRSRSGQLLECLVGDGRRTLSLTFFGRLAFKAQSELKVGRWGMFAGKVTDFKGARQLNHPQYVMLADSSVEEVADELEEFAGALIPVYPATKDIASWTIANCVRLALDLLTPPPDPLPTDLRARHKLLELDAALRCIHRPTDWADLAPARKRLKFDEAFAVQVRLVQRKLAAASDPGTPRPARADGLLAAFDATLPFTLTDGQTAVGEDIATDLAKAHPMHRLLQGEVGSGKTLVALRAMLQVVDSGAQAALLAPTEVLAVQHYRNLLALLGPLAMAGELGAVDDATRIALVTGSLGAAARRRAAEEVASGAAGIVVGTHALLYDAIAFHDLGLVVVDEQHRFGVEQRDALRSKAARTPPHVLVMTATPIPRTVAMTVYGDLETSSLTELPRGRSPIATHVVPTAEKPAYFDRAWSRLREEVAKGHQAYVVCPRIGEAESDEDVELDSERRPPVAVLDVAPSLAEGPLQGLRIGILHGRLPADEKDAVMREFTAGKLDVLVATTVIEVGVDVPNATMMVIMDADRFGVSQLHQLRGRVGRGSAPGLCLLVTEAIAESPSRERLDSVASTTDGFRLAELDLEQRREGDVLGASQSGRRSHLRLLSLLRDADLIRDARIEAIELVGHDPELSAHPALADTIAALVDEERAEYLEKA